MFYHNLKEIIEHIEKTVKCPHCEAHYNGKQLEILYLHGSKVAVIAHCKECSASTTVVISEEAPKARSIALKKRAPGGGKISMNDVLDIKSFMQGFSGSFKDMLK